MVDKENLWDDDMEYSQEDVNDSEYEESASFDDEYSEQGYDEEDYGDYDEDEEDDEDEDYDADKSSKNKKNNQLLLLIIALLLLGLAGFLVMSKMNSGDQISDAGDINSNSSMEQTFGGESLGGNSEQGNAASTEEMGDMFFEQAGGNSSDMMSFDFNNNDGSAQVATNDNEKVATVTDANNNPPLSQDDLFGSSDGVNISSGTENNDIIVSYDKEKVVRENPFKPPVYVKQKEVHDNKVVVNNTQFEIIEPPTASVPDENLTRILQTQVSGILYDEQSPSAIVNLNGVDTFVKVGDKLSGYKIQSITEDKVQVNYKNNSYVASVGELFVRGQLEKQRAVADLEHKFAGRYKNEKAQ